MCLARLLGYVPKRAPFFFIWIFKSPVTAECCERGLLLDRQLIERKMLALLGKRALQFRLPRRRRLSGPRVNQVEGNAREMRAGNGDRSKCFFRAMQPAEKFQRIIFQRLHAERYAIDPRRAVAAKA